MDEDEYMYGPKISLKKDIVQLLEEEIQKSKRRDYRSVGFLRAATIGRVNGFKRAIQLIKRSRA